MNQTIRGLTNKFPFTQQRLSLILRYSIIQKQFENHVTTIEGQEQKTFSAQSINVN